MPAIFRLFGFKCDVAEEGRSMHLALQLFVGRPPQTPQVLIGSRISRMVGEQRYLVHIRCVVLKVL